MNVGERAIRSICVAGSGVVALSAALAFARALPRVRLSILETPRDPAALADHPVASLPAIHRFHAAIPLEELELVRSGIATHLLGTRFEHWSASGEPWYHVFGDYGIPAAGADFHNVWLAARREGRASSFDRYAAAAALARAGKFVHPSNDPNSPFANFLYALRLDPERYRLRLEAAAARLPRVQGGLLGIERRGDGGIGALLLDGDVRIEADLFLDCTGPAALLASVVNPDFEDWSQWLPCDRLTRGEEPAQEPAAHDRIEATGAGWRWRAPLADRALVTELSSSAFAGEAPEHDTIAIRTGRRRSPWKHNVLAVGDAAVAVDPMHGTNLHLAQSAILRALELLPGRDCHPLELAEYNRRTLHETVRVRDFLALHYLRSGRRDTPFWAALAEIAPPPALGRTLGQFERRGRLPLFEEECFDKHSWAAALIGLGVLPRHVDAVAAGVDSDRAAPAMEALAGRIESLAAGVPPYSEVLARMKAAPAR